MELRSIRELVWYGKSYGTSAKLPLGPGFSNRELFSVVFWDKKGSEELNVCLAEEQSASSGPVPAIPHNYLSFLNRLLAERPRARRSQGVAGHMSTAYQIGRPGPHASIHYDDQDFGRADALLAQHGQPKKLSVPKPTRYAPLHIASNANVAEVERPLSPALSKVAVLPLDMGFGLPYGTDHLTMAWDAAAALQFSLVLLCDTLSCLGRLHEYPWLRSTTRNRPTLVLYSGQPGGIYRTEAVRRFLASSWAPVVAVVPFDPSGLAKANGIPRLEALALPDLTVIEKLAAFCTYDGDFALQVRRHRGELDMARHPQVASLWTAMQKLGNGVDISSFGLVV